jgi:excisionase family DNA binding protein
MPKETLNTNDAADLLCISVSTLRRWISMGKITCHKIGGCRMLFYRSELDEFIRGGYINKGVDKK